METLREINKKGSFDTHYVVIKNNYKISTRNNNFYIQKNSNMFLEINVARLNHIIARDELTNDSKVNEVVELFKSLSDCSKNALKIESKENHESAESLKEYKLDKLKSNKSTLFRYTEKLEKYSSNLNEDEIANIKKVIVSAESNIERLEQELSKI